LIEPIGVETGGVQMLEDVFSPYSGHQLDEFWVGGVLALPLENIGHFYVVELVLV
jgi:hypothetical protein